MLAFGIVFTTAGALFAQVHIQEKAVITPAQAKKVREESTAHKIKFTFDWVTWGISVPETARVEIVGGCQFDSVYSLTGISKGEGAGYGNSLDIEFSLPTAGDYAFFASIFKYNHYDTGIFCTLSYDDSLVYFITGTTEGSDNDSVNVWRRVLWHWGDGYATRNPLYFETPYCSSFSLDLYGFPLWMPPGFYGKGVDYGQEIGIYLNDSYDCSPNIWHPYDPITLSIISGHQYASFYTSDLETGNDVKLDSVVNTTGEGIGNYYLVADSVQPDSVAGWVIVKAECDGITSIDSAQVLPPPVVVKVIPPEVAPGDTAAVILKQRNPDGTLADFPSYLRFEVQIDSGSNYGTILSQGDTADYFESIPQGFEFIAVDSITSDSEMVGIQVGPVQGVAGIAVPGGKGPGMKDAILKNKSVSVNVKSPPVKSLASMKTNGGRKSVSFTQGDYGIGWVEIKKQKYILKILDHDPWSIWPDLPPGAITRKETNPPGYNHKRGFTISVTDENGRPPKQPMVVEITHNYQQGTGGHAHGDAGSKSLVPPQDLQGTFYGQRGSGSFLMLTTDANGMAVVDSLVGSQISGTYLITAYLVSDPSIKDTVNLNVQVPGLVDFGTWSMLSFQSFPIPYILFQSDSGRANHPSNDYCTVAMVDSLFWATLDFYFWSASPEGVGEPIILSLNDMSLPWGGVFDICDTWQPLHKSHRIGHSVDINNGGLFQYPNPKNSNVPIMTDLGIMLEHKMNHYGGYRIPEGNSVHYEFYKAY